MTLFILIALLYEVLVALFCAMSLLLSSLLLLLLIIQFPKSDVRVVIENIRRSERYGEEQVTKKFLFRDPESCDLIPYDSMAEILIELQPNITEHELMTIGRHFEEKRGHTEKPIIGILANVRENLRKTNYDNYEELLKSLKYEDQQK